MTKGPPPSAAESSSSSSSSTPIQASQPTPPPGPNAASPAAGYPSIPYYNYGSWPTSWSTSYVPSQGAAYQLPPQYNPQSFHGYYAGAQASLASASTNPVVAHASQAPTVAPTNTNAVGPASDGPVKLKRRSPSPPPLETYGHWDEVVKDFLVEAGLEETLHGFERDMLVLSPDLEEEQIPKALKKLIERLTNVPEVSDSVMRVDGGAGGSQSLDERKLDYVRLANDEKPRTPTSINKSISQFLAKNRARNNASNRAEFLYSLSERRRQMQPKPQEEPKGAIADDDENHTVDPRQVFSCARTDARPINRDEQMKYDIAKNNDGPLSRTIATKGSDAEGASSGFKAAAAAGVGQKRSQGDDESVTAARYPALDERLRNVETHFAVRYVPSPPRTLVARLKFLEEHIIKLEKEYPPWAALHFNQPNRGWPPPPRSTPIIVPPNLRSSERDIDVKAANNNPTTNFAYSTTNAAAAASRSDTPPSSLGALAGAQRQKNGKSRSSLHRAVMEKLEVQRAMNDLGNGNG